MQNEHRQTAEQLRNQAIFLLELSKVEEAVAIAEETWMLGHYRGRLAAGDACDLAAVAALCRTEEGDDERLTYATDDAITAATQYWPEYTEADKQVLGLWAEIREKHRYLSNAELYDAYRNLAAELRK